MGSSKRGRVAVNAAITSASQFASMAAGGVLAVLVAARIGSNAATDGFFAAYAVYSTVVLLAQSARTTIVARVLEGGTGFAAFNRYLGGGLLIAVAGGILLGPLGGLVAGLLTGDLPDVAQSTARSALLVLTPAIALQLFAAIGAAMLGALESFLAPGAAFVAGGIFSVVAFAFLEPGMGLDGLAVAILLGSVVSAAVVAAALISHGWRPSSAVVAAPRESARAAGIVLIASLSLLIAQVGFLVTLSVGARLGEGLITVFNYAFLAYGLVFAVLVSSVPMVIAAPIARTWDRRPESLLLHSDAIFRTGLLLAIPVAAAAALIGDEVARFVLAKFSDREVVLMIDLFLLLLPGIACGLAQAVPYAAVLAMGRYREIAAVTTAAVGVQVAVTLTAGVTGSEHLLALAFVAGALASAVAMFLLVSRRYAGLVSGALVAATARIGLVGCAGFGSALLLAHGIDPPSEDAVALGLGLLAYGALIRLLGGSERELAGRLVRAILPARA